MFAKRGAGTGSFKLVFGGGVYAKVITLWCGEFDAEKNGCDGKTGDALAAVQTGRKINSPIALSLSEGYGSQRRGRLVR